MHKASKEKLIPAFYRYRVPVAFACVLSGLVTAQVDPFARVSTFTLVVGFLIALLGALLRLWASSYTWPNITASSPTAQQGLVTAGPYAFVRNPLYLGAIFLVLGLNVALGSLLAAITMLIPTVVTHYWQARYEESFLASEFGEEYAKYQQNVPLLIPRPWRVYKDRFGDFDIVQGVKMDIGPLSGFLILCIMIVLLSNRATLGPLWLTIILIGSVLLSLILVPLVRRL